RDSDGNDRINLNDTDLSGMYDKLQQLVGTEMADFILAIRLYGAYNANAQQQPPQQGPGGADTVVRNANGPVTKNQLDMNRQAQALASIASLINSKVGISQVSQVVTVSTVSGPRGVTQTTTVRTITTITVYNSPLNDASKQRDLLPLLYDKCTTRKDTELPARVNLLTAPKAVLTSLPGLEDSDVQTIIERRPAIGSADNADSIYQTPAWLVTEANLPATKVGALERYVTSRTQV